MDGHNVILNMDGSVVDGPRLRQVLIELKQCKLDRLILNFWQELAIPETPGWSARWFDTSVIDLGAGAEVALDRMDAKSRRMAQQAQRRGVSCAPRTDHAGVEIFFDMLPERWANARPLVSKRFLQILVDQAGPDVELRFAYYEGKPIAGGVALYGSKEVYVWLTAVDEKMATFRPLSILHVDAIRAAAARGMRWYNLGSSEGLPMVKRLKDAFGGTTTKYARLTLEKNHFRLYRRFREGLTGR